jgi:hypothetical protein
MCTVPYGLADRDVKASEDIMAHLQQAFLRAEQPMSRLLDEPRGGERTATTSSRSSGDGLRDKRRQVGGRAKADRAALEVGEDVELLPVSADAGALSALCQVGAPVVFSF